MKTLLVAVSALALPPQATRIPAPVPALYGSDALDHIMLWTSNVDRATSALAVRMGFQVRSGASFEDGSANRLVRFPDNSFLELLYFTRPEAKLSGDALEDYKFTQKSGGGVSGFAIAVDDVDATRSYLSSRGLALNSPEPLTIDFDGDGPQKPLTLWRTLEFANQPLTSSDLFFIRYTLPAMSAQRAADEAALTTHPNGAVGLSAVWLLSANIKADGEKLAHMGFGRGEAVQLPHFGASGLRFNTAREAIILLQPDGPGTAADAVAARGSQVFGASIAVRELGRAQRFIERGYGTKLVRYQGVMGEAVSAPSREELGLIIEFHESK